jgi:hypothetical protein
MNLVRARTKLLEIAKGVGPGMLPAFARGLQGVLPPGEVCVCDRAEQTIARFPFGCGVSL